MWWWMLGGLVALALMKSDNNRTFKLGGLHIKQYKMFKDLTMSFVDLTTKKALPIIVVAGKNGTGKTTLLEYLADYSADNRDDYVILTKLINNQVKSSKMRKGEDGIIEIRAEYKKTLKYMKVDVNNVGNFEEFVSNYYIDLAEKYDSFSKSKKELQGFIKKSLNGLELNFNVSSIDYKVKKVFFKKNDSDTEFGIEALSTGEKTLISKVLSLYFEQIKNQIILIDEPELSLHPSWQNKILSVYENFAKENNCQIIIATHSPHIIGSAKNEYLRILRKKEDGSIEVINDLKAHGRDINSILFDVMGEVAYRPREFKDKIDKLYEDIDNRKFEEAKEKLAELKKDYGEKDNVVQEAEILIDVLSSEE